MFFNNFFDCYIRKYYFYKNDIRKNVLGEVILGKLFYLEKQSLVLKIIQKLPKII